MPLYDFSCPACGTVENVMAGMNDAYIACPKCGKEPAKKLFSPPRAIIPDIEPYIDENLGPEPIRVESRRHLNQLLRERGLIQKRALSHKDQLPVRWI